MCGTRTLKNSLWIPVWFHSENIQNEVKEPRIVFMNRVMLLSSLCAAKEALCSALPPSLSLSVPSFSGVLFLDLLYVFCSFLSACCRALRSILCVWIQGHKRRSSRVFLFYKVVGIDVGSVFCKPQIYPDFTLLCYVTHLVRVRKNISFGLKLPAFSCHKHKWKMSRWCLLKVSSGFTLTNVETQSWTAFPLTPPPSQPPVDRAGHHCQRVM